MYAFIVGTVEEKSADRVVLLAGGVGYEIFVSSNTAGRCAPVGQTQKLFTYLHPVTEGGFCLYGFADREEKAMFERLIGVTRIGPKLALAILSALEPRRLALAIVAGDEAAFKGISGVGAKAAQRIILELKDSMAKQGAAIAGLPTTAAAPQNAEQEAISALVTLGYGATEAAQAVAKVAQNCTRVEEIIFNALKQFDR